MLIAIGAILAFAVSFQSSGIDINAVGAILMVVGLVGLLLSFLAFGDFGWFGGGHGTTTTSAGHGHYETTTTPAAPVSHEHVDAVHGTEQETVRREERVIRR
jgi:hypothetical protein